MAEPTELEKLRVAETRLALLALTGEQPEPSSPCLSADQLAALVEGKLPPAEVDACLAHIAACEHCYFQWRQLDREWQEKGAKSRRAPLARLISQPRFLTAAGSLLAAAASIAVFLTLTTRIDRTTLTRLPEKSAQEQMVPAPEPVQPAAPAPAEKSVPAPAPAPPPASRLQAPQADVLANRHESERKKEARSDRTEFKGDRPALSAQPGEEKAKATRRDEQARPAPVVAPAPVAQGDQASSAMAEKKEEENIREATSTAGKAAPRAELQATAPQATTATVDETAPLTLDDWRRRIRQGCQARPDPEFFAAVTRQGKQLLRESVPLSKQDRRQIERILAALGTEQPAEQQCHALLELVDPAVQGQGR